MIPKFRVWDKKRSEMINLIAINFHKYIAMDDLICSCNDGPITRNFQDVVLMQSTGLHDDTKFEDLSEEEQEEWLESGKTADEWQGREVFEGDIVNINTTFRNPMTGSGTLTLNKNFEVVFINGMFTRDGTSMGISKDLKYLTVVGDVYKNPELLEDV